MKKQSGAAPEAPKKAAPKKAAPKKAAPKKAAPKKAAPKKAAPKKAAPKKAAPKKAAPKKAAPKKAAPKKAAPKKAAPAEASERRGNFWAWYDGRPNLRKLLDRSLERAKASSEKRAGFAVGRRRLELRLTPGGSWDVFDWKTGDEAPFVARRRAAAKPRVLNAETPAQFKRRMSREIDRDNRRKEREAKKKERAEASDKVRATRKARQTRLKRVTAGCKAAVDAARKTEPRNARRVAVAGAQVRCAVARRGVEEHFATRLNKLERDVAALRAPRAARPRKASAQRGSARHRREERDDAVRDELERRGLRELVPVWDRMKDAPGFRSLSFDRAIERFAEAIAEDPQLVDVQHERYEDEGEYLAAEAACGQAAEYAAGGDVQAALWAEENCPGGKPRRKPSARERTISMFEGIVPPAEARRAGGKGGRARRGQGRQGTLAVGRFGAPLVAAPGQQAL